ncbi:MAG: nucleotidyl transferase AbiEii/AbiGii toxin family protein [Deltaproteobacteria bacterium]|nr:nucleotidyl transferase AbiEii/AbiGii toxin family protein [Deltaproteobacteria bacterium]
MTYKEKRVKQSEMLQLLLLDNVYSQSGSENIIFQGGTALRWVYGGMRFSEDIDFVTRLSRKDIESILTKTYTKILNACIAQFGPGLAEQQIKSSRRSAFKVFFIYRPEVQRERIAVKLEFEILKQDQQPEFERHILRELPQVAGLVTAGQLILPYTSSIILAETPDEILSDKIRALFERSYIKGRDVYDIWWIVTQIGITPCWSITRRKLSMYQARFVPAREADYFQNKASAIEISKALESDLPRFIPQNIFSIYREEKFRPFINTLKQVTADLLDQGMESFLNKCTKKSPH